MSSPGDKRKLNILNSESYHPISLPDSRPPSPATNMECTICFESKPEFEKKLCHFHTRICQECHLKMFATFQVRCPFCRRDYDQKEVEKVIDAAPIEPYQGQQPPPAPKKSRPQVESRPSSVVARRLSF